MNNLEICSICNKGHMIPGTAPMVVEYNGCKGEFQIHISICNHCGAESSDADQVLKNKCAWAQFKTDNTV